MMSALGTSPLVRLKTKVNAAVYKNMLENRVIPALKESGATFPIFMQDNASCHKAKLVINYLSDQRVGVMDWPAQSPDMNPIKNLWKTVSEKVKARNPNNVEDL